MVLDSGWVLLPQETLAITTGNVLGCHHWGSRGMLLASRGRARNAVKHPTIHRVDPTTKNNQPKLSIVIRLRNPCCLVAQSCPTLCDPMDWRTPGLPCPSPSLKFAQVHVHCISDAIQPSHPLTPSSSSALSLFQHQGLLQWVSCWHLVTKILEFQHQSFQWVSRVHFP